MEIGDEPIRAAAAMFGADLADDQLREYAERASRIGDSLDVFEPYLPDARSAWDIDSGDDRYNSVRFTFATTRERGPLADLDVGVKDNLAVAGVPMTCGSGGLSFTPSYDATAVRRLREAGANLTATTNMDEFAYFATGEFCAHGCVENPRVEGCVPGGSSSGSAAAVAGSLLDCALGTDTGGSVRIPATFCGIVGFKPTYRSVSRFGLANLAPSLDTVGPLATTVDDASRVLDTITGHDVRDPSTFVSPTGSNVTTAPESEPSNLVVGTVEESLDCSEEGVVETVRGALDGLESRDVTVKDVSLPAYDQTTSVGLGIISFEFARVLANGGHVYGAGTGSTEEWRTAVVDMVEEGRYSDAVRDNLVVYSALDEATDGRLYVGAQNARRRFTADVLTALEDVDALVTPTTPITAPEFGTATGADDIRTIIANTIPFNLTGNPAVSVPCGASDGKPVGLQIVTGWHEEAVGALLGRIVESLPTGDRTS